MSKSLGESPQNWYDINTLLDHSVCAVLVASSNKVNYNNIYSSSKKFFLLLLIPHP